MRKENFLVTGSSGFIGYHLCRSLLLSGFNVFGIDNLNDYYSVELKNSRTSELKKFKNFRFKKIDLQNRESLDQFKKIEFHSVVNLAAQAGVRHSFNNPLSYIDNNINTHTNILDFAHNNKIKQVLYASTSSVYGDKNEVPFEESMDVSHPSQIYSASKASCELISTAYANMFKLNIVGLRFFTVYGEWGRPDMAFFKFLEQINKNEHITLFNYGKHSRSFTYIDDLIYYIRKILQSMEIKSSNVVDREFHKIYNVGNPDRVSLSTIIDLLESRFPNKIKVKYLEFQQGDILDTQPSLKKLFKDFGTHDFTNIQVGLNNFIDWYQEYKKIGN